MYDFSLLETGIYENVLHSCSKEIVMARELGNTSHNSGCHEPHAAAMVGNVMCSSSPFVTRKIKLTGSLLGKSCTHTVTILYKFFFQSATMQ